MDALVLQKIGALANFGHPSNCWDYTTIKSNVSDVAVNEVGMDVHIKFGDSWSNGSQDIRCADCVSNKNEHDRGLLRPKNLAVLTWW